jgi:hypothetical protein
VRNIARLFSKKQNRVQDIAPLSLGACAGAESPVSKARAHRLVLLSILQDVEESSATVPAAPIVVLILGLGPSPTSCDELEYFIAVRAAQIFAVNEENVRRRDEFAAFCATHRQLSLIGRVPARGAGHCGSLAQVSSSRRNQLTPAPHSLRQAGGT